LFKTKKLGCLQSKKKPHFANGKKEKHKPKTHKTKPKNQPPKKRQNPKQKEQKKPPFSKRNERLNTGNSGFFPVHYFIFFALFFFRNCVF